MCGSFFDVESVVELCSHQKDQENIFKEFILWNGGRGHLKAPGILYVQRTFQIWPIGRLYKWTENLQIIFLLSLEVIFVHTFYKIDGYEETILKKVWENRNKLPYLYYFNTVT